MTAKLLLPEEVTVPEAIIRVLEETGIDMVFGFLAETPGGFLTLYTTIVLTSERFWFDRNPLRV